jgi:chromosome partitioning protein
MGETVEATAGQPGFKRAHVIIVGNEKGGSGKTTTTMHLIIALLRLGFSVGSIDIDSRQRSLTRYFENRRQTVAKQGVPLPMPHHIVIQKSPFDSVEEAKADERDRFAKGLARIYGTCDFVVIDTPGNDTYLSRLAHSFAHTVITPINDSFVDLDVLASVDGETLNIVKPSIYAEMVWEQKLQRAKRDGGSIDWIVMRNRLSNIDARNKRFMTKVTEELARRIGFRVAPGFSERVIFREMFLQGLTVLDVLETDNGGKLSISHVAARQEVRSLLQVLKIPAIDQRIEKLRTGEAEEEVKSAAEAMAKLDTDEPEMDPAPTAAKPEAPVQQAAPVSPAPASVTAAAPAPAPTPMAAAEPVKAPVAPAPASPAVTAAPPAARMPQPASVTPSASTGTSPIASAPMPSTSPAASKPITLDSILNAPLRPEPAAAAAPASAAPAPKPAMPPMAGFPSTATAAPAAAKSPTLAAPAAPAPGEALKERRPEEASVSSRPAGPVLTRIFN